jgi:hypothetical protein
MGVWWAVAACTLSLVFLSRKNSSPSTRLSTRSSSAQTTGLPSPRRCRRRAAPSRAPSGARLRRLSPSPGSPSVAWAAADTATSSSSPASRPPCATTCRRTTTCVAARTREGGKRGGRGRRCVSKRRREQTLSVAPFSLTPVPRARARSAPLSPPSRPAGCLRRPRLLRRPCLHRQGALWPLQDERHRRGGAPLQARLYDARRKVLRHPLRRDRDRGLGGLRGSQARELRDVVHGRRGRTRRALDSRAGEEGARGCACVGIVCLRTRARWLLGGSRPPQLSCVRAQGVEQLCGAD